MAPIGSFKGSMSENALAETNLSRKFHMSSKNGLRDFDKKRIGPRDYTKLFLLCWLPFGGHFVRNGLSAANLFLQQSPDLNFTNQKYGIILGAQNLASCFVPLFGAYMMQASWPGPRALILLFSAIIVVGQAVCIVGISQDSIPLSVMGSMLMGAGTGCCVMIQRSTVTQIFQKSSAVALGFCVGTANVGKTLSRISMALLSDWSEDSLMSLYFELLPCLLSVFVALLYVNILAAEDEVHSDGSVASNSSQSIEMRLAKARSSGAGRPRSLSGASDSSARTRMTDSTSYSRFEFTGTLSGDEAEKGISPLTDGDHHTEIPSPLPNNPFKVGTLSSNLGTEIQSLPLMGTRSANDIANPAIAHYSYQSIVSDTGSSEALSRGGFGAAHTHGTTTTTSGLHRCPVWFVYTLIGATVVMHAVNVNSFHLMSQFGPPILEASRNTASPLLAGLTTSVTTMLPIVGAPLTGIFLDKAEGEVTLPVVAVLSFMATISFYMLLYTDNGSVLELLLVISFCEAIMPTAIMAHLPFLINGAATSCDSSVDASYGHLVSADDERRGDEEEEDQRSDVTITLLEGEPATKPTPTPDASKNRPNKKVQICSIHVVFACMGVGDAAVVMAGIAVLGYTLDHKGEGTLGSHIIFFLSATATLLAIILIIAETFVSRLYKLKVRPSAEETVT